MSIKKYSSGQWVDTPYRKYETATDTITTLPKQIIGDGTGIKGKNIFDVNGWFSSLTGVRGNGTITLNGNTVTITSNEEQDAYTLPYTANASGTFIIPVKPNTVYRIKSVISDKARFIIFENGLAQTEYMHTQDGPFTTQSDCSFLTLRMGVSSTAALGTSVTISNFMISEGGTERQYEPYYGYSIQGSMSQSGTPTSVSPIFPSECGELVESGEHSGEYVLPIICGNTTTPYYMSAPIRKLGNFSDIASDTGVTRYIKKLVLNGNTNIVKNVSTATNYLYYIPTIYPKDNYCICSHLPYSESNLVDNIGIKAHVSRELIYINFGADIMNAQTSGNTAAGLKEYLQAQYDAGTPVCVWYVLSTPTTETFTAPTIPTIDGEQTFDVDTTLKPSEVSLTYHGWHSHSDTKY